MYFVTILYGFWNQIHLSTANEENDYSLPEEHWLSKNSLLHTFPSLEQEWNISFEVNPTRVEEGERNILHLVFSEAGEGHTLLEINIKSSKCNSGWQGCLDDRRLQLSCKYLYDGETLRTYSFTHYNVYTTPHQWTKIEVRKKYYSGRHYKLFFNSGGRKIERWAVNQKVLRNVELYATDPHQEAQPGQVKGLHVINGQIGLCHIYILYVKAQYHFVCCFLIVQV